MDAWCREARRCDRAWDGCRPGGVQRPSLQRVHPCGDDLGRRPGDFRPRTRSEAPRALEGGVRARDSVAARYRGGGTPLKRALVLLNLVAGLGAETVAIINARVFPVSAPPLERATVVMRDGRIAAVGSRVSIPAGARKI